MKKLVLFVVVVALAAGIVEVASACPGCGNAILNGKNENAPNTTTAFYYSILFMLGVPFGLLGGFSFAFYRLHQKAVAMQEAGRPAPAAENIVPNGFAVDGSLPA